MFEFLSLAKPEQAVSVASHAIRLIEWRGVLGNDLIGAAKTLKNQLPAAEKKLALRTLSEIQQAENTPLHELPESAADKYVSWLAGIATGRAEEILSDSDLERGRKILATWKEEGEDNIFQYELAALDGVSLIAPGPRRGRTLQRMQDEMLERFLELSEEELRAETIRLKESLFRLKFKLKRGEVDAVKRIRKEKESLRFINSIMRQKTVEGRKEN